MFLKLLAIFLMLASLAGFGAAAFSYDLNVFQLSLLVLLMLLAVITLRVSCDSRKLQSLLILFFSVSLGEAVLLYVALGLNRIIAVSGLIALAGLLVSLAERGKLMPIEPKIPEKGKQSGRQISVTGQNSKIKAGGLRKRFARGRIFVTGPRNAKKEFNKKRKNTAKKSKTKKSRAKPRSRKK